MHNLSLLKAGTTKDRLILLSLLLLNANALAEATMEVFVVPARGLDGRFRGHDGSHQFKTTVTECHSRESGNPAGVLFERLFRNQSSN